MTVSSPLAWPPGRPRAKSREPSRFKAKSWDTEIQVLGDEVERLKGRNPVLTTNYRIRLGGAAIRNEGEPGDPGVALYFDLRGKKHTFACDRWNRVIDNVHAIRLTIEAIRGIGRWGSGDMVDLAFTGFAALPPPDAASQPPVRPWWEVLGVQPDVPMPVIKAVYRELSKKAHPDAGGSADAMARLNAALAEAEKAVSVRGL